MEAQAKLNIARVARLPHAEGLTVQPPAAKRSPRDTVTVAWCEIASSDAAGYGIVRDNLLRAVVGAGAAMAHRWRYHWDIRVAVSIPRAYLLGRGQGKVDDLVFHTMWDTESLPPFWDEMLNRCPAVWVPSQWCKEVFVASGVTVPIYVSGYGVWPKEFSPRRKVDAQGRDVPPNDEGTYTFLWGGDALGDGRMYGGRKGGHLVLQAFGKLKLPNARLVLKCSQRSVVNEVHAPNVTLVHGDLPRDEYIGLVASSDCFIYPSAGEGFGLTPLEAMACGLPTIVPRYSGMAEYVDEDVAVVLPVAGKTEAWLYRKVFGYSSQWAFYSVDDIAERMKWCYEHRSEARAIGQRAAERIAERWQWERAGQEGLAVLRKIVYGE